jgi:Fic family protein
MRGLYFCRFLQATNDQVIYTPPDYNLLPPLIFDFCNYANSNNDDLFIHPIVRASLLHFLIGYIHPFADGNGRTARAIFYWSLIKQGYWLIEFMPISRTISNAPSKYSRAYLYTENDENDFSYFLRYMLQAINLAMTDLKKYLARQMEKKKNGKITELMSIKSINLRQIHILEIFIKNPSKNMMISEVQNTFDVAYQTARTDLVGLENIGFIVSNKGRWNKLIFTRSSNFEEIIRKQLEFGEFIDN